MLTPADFLTSYLINITPDVSYSSESSEFIPLAYGDIASLKPLPINRMLRQAGRPARRQWESNEYGRIYGSKPLPLGPERSAEILRRHKQTREVINEWNPLRSEDKQRLNNTNPAPRSRPSAPGVNPVHTFFNDLRKTAESRRNKAFRESSSGDPMWGYTGSKFKKEYGNLRNAESTTDPSLFLTDQERNAAKSMIFDYLDSVAGRRGKLSKNDLPWQLRQDMPKLGNDMLYEWNARRGVQARESVLDMLEASREFIRPIDTSVTPSNRRPDI